MSVVQFYVYKELRAVKHCATQIYHDKRNLYSIPLFNVLTIKAHDFHNHKQIEAERSPSKLERGNLSPTRLVLYIDFVYFSNYVVLLTFAQKWSFIIEACLTVILIIHFMILCLYPLFYSSSAFLICDIILSSCHVC